MKNILARGGVEYVPPVSLAFWRWLTVFLILLPFFFNEISNKRKQFKDEVYWGKPITGFGDPKGKILFVGLAPAAHGGTRTGRVFTGDKSSDFLYKCLFNA